MADKKIKQQTILKFENNPSFKDSDYFVSECNRQAYDNLFKWPKWDSKLINLVGPKGSGKSHLLEIFSIKNNFLKVNSLAEIKKKLETIIKYDKLIMDDINQIDEKVFFSILDNYISNNKFLIISTIDSLLTYKFKLADLKSRITLFHKYEIYQPNDKMIYFLIQKFLSDRQIKIKKDLITHIIKKIDRSYNRIMKFIDQIDRQSLSNNKKIDYKLINNILDN